MIYYSKNTGGFYDTNICNINIPKDAVEISIERHQELLNAQYNGRKIISNNSGYPVDTSHEASILTWENIKYKRNSLLKDSDWIDLPNSPSKNKQQWLDYRQLLRDIPQSFNTPDKVIWPSLPS